MTQKGSLFRFLDWEVYRDAQALFDKVLQVVKELPNEICFSLGDQILRSALSTMLNIAEGSGRGTDKELNRFFNISIGSINETIAGLDALRRNGYLQEEKFDVILEELSSISRQLGGFKKSL